MNYSESKNFEELTTISQNKDTSKLIETTEILNDVKNKLRIQSQQREIYEKQHLKILEVLDIPTGDRSLINFLLAINEVKEILEENHYTNAQAVLKVFSNLS